MTMDELKKAGTQLKEVTDALAHLRKATSELSPELQQKLLDLFFVKEKEDEIHVNFHLMFDLIIWDRDIWGKEHSAGDYLDCYLAALDSHIRDFLLREKIEATGKVRYIEDTREIFDDILGDEQEG